MRVALRIQVRARRATRPHLFVPPTPPAAPAPPALRRRPLLDSRDGPPPSTKQNPTPPSTPLARRLHSALRARAHARESARAERARRSRGGSAPVALPGPRGDDAASPRDGAKNRDRLVARVAAKAARRNELAARTAANAAAVAETVKAAVADRAVPRDDWYAKRSAAQRAAAAIQRAWRRYFSRRRTCSPERQNQTDWPSPLRSAAAAVRGARPDPALGAPSSGRLRPIRRGARAPRDAKRRRRARLGRSRARRGSAPGWHSTRRRAVV